MQLTEKPELSLAFNLYQSERPHISDATENNIVSHANFLRYSLL